MSPDRAREILQTYSFAEILENNDLTEEDVICILVEQGAVLPETLPL